MFLSNCKSSQTTTFKNKRLVYIGPDTPKGPDSKSMETQDQLALESPEFKNLKDSIAPYDVQRDSSYLQQKLEQTIKDKTTEMANAPFPQKALLKDKIDIFKGMLKDVKKTPLGEIPQVLAFLKIKADKKTF